MPTGINTCNNTDYDLTEVLSTQRQYNWCALTAVNLNVRTLIGQHGETWEKLLPLGIELTTPTPLLDSKHP